MQYQNRPQGFAAWDYGIRKELSKRHGTPSDWLKHGPIMFEPVSATALTIENIFERECPRPFHRLPPEMRQMVYTCLKYAEHGARVLFKAELPLEPDT